MIWVYIATAIIGFTIGATIEIKFFEPLSRIANALERIANKK